MTRKERSFIFIILTSLCNILITLCVVIALTTAVVFFMIKVLHFSTDSIILQVLLPFVFIAGLITGLFIFTRFTGFIIKALHLEEKLTPDVVQRYSRKNKNNL